MAGTSPAVTETNHSQPFGRAANWSILGPVQKSVGVKG
jgi:hypothetical protein